MCMAKDEQLKKIKIRGARVHNLKNVNLDLPRDQFIVFTGLSGSGKSSLAFDTIFAEGQRRYVESLSPYARQFLGQMEKPDVDEITGLSPAIAIDQKAHSRNPRSTVATLTEIYDYMRVLFARIGRPHCPSCNLEIKKMSIDEMLDTILARVEEKNSKVLTILGPIVRGRKGEYYQLLQDLFSDGFSEARIDGEVVSLHDKIELKRYGMHTIEVVVDKVMPSDKLRAFEALETGLHRGQGLVTIIFDDMEEMTLSSHWSCPNDGFSFPEIEPRLFSFNSPYGACEECHGIGRNMYGVPGNICSSCEGRRLKPEVLAIKIYGKNIHELVTLTIDNAFAWFVEISGKLTSNEKKIGENLLKEITSRLEFLLEVGLEYLTLNRESGSLSGGESQRIRLASQIGSKLSGTLYVLDEPTIGLHERDNDRLLKILKDLKNLGNSLIVVEHDERVIKESDYLVDIGPGPGVKGGNIVESAPTAEVLKQKDPSSLTVKYLLGKEKIEIPEKRRGKDKGSVKVIGISKNNIENIDVEIPLARLVCITGVSGSGKSTLLSDVFYKNVGRKISGFNHLENAVKVIGTEYIKKIIEIDQSPIGKTPRSNPATYTGVFTPIRDLFSLTAESRERGYTSSRFSFNVKGGRCEECTGAGVKIIEMHFLPDVAVKCDICHGKRFNRETLEVKYKKKNIAEILEMTVAEAYDMFEDVYYISDKLKVLKEVGLEYIKLGQSATTLSGGEAQRIKLAKELARPMARNVLFILDEPTTGLHYQDVKMLLDVLNKLVDKGNTVVLIEHNMHVIKTADWIIDLGPEGGANGGKIVAQGVPEDIIKVKKSHTGRYLKEYLD